MKEQIKACQEALQRNPKDQETFNQLSQLLQEGNRLKALVGLYEKYPELANWEQLVDILAKAANTESSPEKQSGILHVIGQLFEMRLGRPDRAIKCYQQAVRTYSQRTESFDAARRIYTANNNIQMVVKLLQIELGVLENGSNDERKARVFLELSLLCKHRIGNEEKANEFERKARDIANDYVDSIYDEISSLYAIETALDASTEADEPTKDDMSESEASSESEAASEASSESEELAEVSAEEVVESEASSESEELAEVSAEEVVSAEAAASDEVAVAEEVAVEEAAAVEEVAVAEEVVSEEVAAAEEVAVEEAAAVEEVAVAEEVAVEEAAASDEVAVAEEVVEEAAAVEEEVAAASAEEVAAEVASEEVAVEEEVTAEAVLQDLEACCELIYRNVDNKNACQLAQATQKGIQFVQSQDDAREIAAALEEIEAYDDMAELLKGLSEKAGDERSQKYAKAWYSDILDRYLDRREEAVAVAEPLAEGDDALVSYKAKSVVLGKDESALRALTATMADTTRKLRHTPDEIPMMLDLAIIYEKRLNSMKEAEEQYKRVKSADAKNMAVLRFYNRLYRETQDWLRLQNNLKLMKGVVQGSYRELGVVREIAQVSEEKLNNPGKAINEWNQLMKEGRFVAEAREELIGLYTRAQKWQALIEIYKNDMDALPEDNKDERVALLRKCIDIYDNQLKLDAMVIKMYNQILEIDPADEDAANQLVARYEASKRWNDLLRILDQMAKNTTDTDRAVDTYYRIATIWSSNLGNVAKSIEPLTRVIEIDPSQRKALKQLHEFYEQRNSWANLYDILEKEAAVSESGEKIELLKRQADIGEHNLRSSEKAIASWEAVSEALEDPSEALQELIRLYGKESNNEALLGVYKRQLTVAHSESERIDTLEQIAHLYLDKLNNRDAAIETYQDMLSIEEGKDRALSSLTQLFVSSHSWDELVNLYTQLGLNEQIYELLDLTAGELDSSDERMSLYERMTDVAEKNVQSSEMAVAALEKILEISPNHEATAKRLLAYYTENGEHEKSIKMHQILLELTNDSSEKLAKYIEIARLYEEELNELTHATAYCAKAIALEPNRSDLREHFENLVSTTQESQTLYDVYTELLKRDDAPDAASVLAIHRQLARVCQNDLSKDEEAIASWEACLAADENDVEAIDALCSLYEANNEWEKLLSVIDRKLALTQDQEEEKSLSFKRAQLLVTQLERIEDAEKSYEHVLELDNANVDALAGLKGIYDVSENWSKLAEVLQRELDLMPEDHLEVKFELAEVKRTRLGQLQDAVGLYAEILEENAEHVQTISTLENLIAEGVERHQLAEILIPVYKSSNEFEKLCSMLLIRLETLENDADKLVVWQEIYDIRYNALQDNARAFEAAFELFKLDPQDENVQQNLENLADDEDVENGNERLSALYGTIEADADHDDAWRFEILRRRALIVEEKINNEEESVCLWERLHDHDVDNMEPVSHLEKLYKTANAFDKLVKLYEFKAQHVDSSDEERVAYNLQAAQIYEDILSDKDNAIRIYRAILDIDAYQEDALAALERLFSASEQWQALADLYDSELNLYSDSEKLYDVRCKLAGVCTDHIADYERAVECYSSILSEDKTHAEALSCADALLKRLVSIDVEDAPAYRASLCELLEPIYSENDDKAALVSVLRIKLSDTTDVYDQVELNRRIAFLLLDASVDDKEGAFQAFRSALIADISNVENRSDFEQMALDLEKPQEIIDLYNSKMDDVDDDVLKHDLYSRMAHIYEEQLEDSEKAIGAYRAMIAIDEMDVESLNALENLYTAASNWNELLSVLKLKAEVGSGDDRVNILRKMATINRDCIEDPKGAIENYREILDNVADDRESLDVLEELYAQTEDWKNLVENFATKLNLTDDSEEKRSILNKMASIQEEKLKDYDEATSLHVQILDLFPEDTENLDALDRLYLSQEQYDDLADILQKKLALNANEEMASNLEFRLGQLYAGELSNVDQAIEYYRSILDRDPNYVGAVDALNKLLDDESYKLDVSKVLESVYERTEQNAKLVDILEIQLDLESDPISQVELLKRIALIHQDKLEDMAGAFNDYARIVVIDQSDDNITQIEALCDVNDNPAALVDVYRKVVDAVYDAESQVAFNNRIAAIQLGKLSDEVAAEETYKATLEIQADDVTALNALDALYSKQEAWDKLLNTLEAKLDADPAMDAQLPILLRMASIQEDACHKPDDAIATYIRITDLDNTSTEAKHALERLYEQQEMWQELAELLSGEINDAVSDDDRMALKFRLAKLQHEKLDENFDAIQTLQEIISAQPDNNEVIAYLELLFEKGVEVASIGDILEPNYKNHCQWDKLIHALEIRAQNAEDEFTRVQVLTEIANTWENNLNNQNEALSTYGRIFEIQPADLDTQAQVERLSSATLDLNKWAELYKAALDGDKLDDYSDKRVIMIGLAKLQAERLAQTEEAAKLCYSMLEEDPEELEAYNVLEWIYAKENDYTNLLKLWIMKNEIVQDQDEKIALLLRIATIQEEITNDDAEAAKTFQSILELDPTSSVAASALERLLRKTSQFEALVDFFRNQADVVSSDSERIEVMHKLGVTLYNELHNTDEAVETLRSALEMMPSSTVCKRAVEAMLKNTPASDENAEIRNAMASILEPVYTAAEWSKLANVLDVMINTTDDDITRVELMMRQAALYEEHDMHHQRAFNTYAKAFVAAPASAEARTKVEELSEELNNCADLASVYMDAINHCDDDVEKLQLLERAAVIWNDKLNDSEKAAECYETIVAQDDQNLDAIRALESIYAAASKPEKLVNVLKRHADISSSVIDQKDLYYKIADLQERSLNNNQAAIDAYNTVLDLDSEDQIALDALEALYTKTENWKELINVFQRKIDSASDADERIRLHVSAAKIETEKLNDVDEAIEHYNAALVENAEHITSLDALEAIYESADRTDDLIDNLQTQADLYARNENTAKKQAKLLKMAHILIEKADDKARAVELLSNLVREDGNVEDAVCMLNTLIDNDDLVSDIALVLMPLYREIGDDDAFIRVSQRKIAVSDDEFEKRGLYLDAAKVADQNPTLADKAFGFVADALKAQPSDDEIIEEIKRLTVKNEAYQQLTDLCDQIIEHADDPDVTVKLSLLSADYSEHNLNNVPKTVQLYERILDIDAFSNDALESLNRLYKITGDNEKLADILQKRIDAGHQPINQLRFDLASLRKEEQPVEAFELFKQIIWEDASNEDAINAIESLIRNKDLTNDAVELLEPIYVGRNDNAKLINLLDAKIAVSDDPSESVTLYKRIAQLQIDVNNDKSAALDAYTKALALDASDAEVLASIENIASELQLWNVLADAYSVTAKASDDADAKLSANLKLADLYINKLNDDENAKAVLLQVIDCDAENLDALRKLEGIYERSNDAAQLLNTREKLAELIFEVPEQKKLLFQCADLALNTLNNSDKGIEFYEKINAIDDTDLNAIDPLLKLYADKDMNDKYVDLLNRKLVAVSDDDAQLDIYLTLAKAYDEKLDDPSSAIDNYRNALNIKASDNVYDALEALYAKTEAFQDLDDLLLEQFSKVDNDKARAEILIKRAHIAADKFGDSYQAVEYLKEAMNTDPSNTNAFAELDKLYSAEGNYQELLDLLKEQLDKASSVADKTSINIRIANLAATHLNDADTAIDSLKNVLADDPANLDALTTLISIYEQQNDYDLAMASLKRKLELVPAEQKADVCCELAKLAQKANWSSEQVAECYEQALSFDKKNTVALDALMNIAKASKNVAKQLQLLNVKAENEDDQNARIDIYNDIAKTAADELKDYAVAADALAKIYAIKSDDIDLAANLVNTYLMADDVDHAAPILNDIIDKLTAAKQNKKLPPFLSIKGKMLKKQGDLEAARAAFEQAYNMDKNNIENSLEYGIMLYDAEKYDDSLKIMQGLLLHQMNIKDKETKVRIFYYLGMLRVKTNDPKRAKDMFTRALGVDPNHAPTKEAMAQL